MGAIYVDTSAVGRVMLGEPDAPAINDALRGFDRIIASSLLGVELRRLAMRREMLDRVAMLVPRIALLPIDRPTLTLTETLTPDTLGTLDAIHLATALLSVETAEVEALMTYDKQLAIAAREHGIEVLSPS
ncbi:MAG TPA: PIN domain-containing protein [Solirubrobacteraceae bacterium]|nr:PIN domain-containing protein [Solirubrobacteraceae bacterium]